MKIHLLIQKQTSALLAALFITFSIISCSEVSNQSEESSESAHDDDHAEEGLELTAEQMRSVGIGIAPIEQKNLTAVVKASGQLDVPPQNIAKVNVLTGGVIRQINVQEGEHVQKGARLVIIENQELIKLQQEYLSAKGGFSYIEQEYQRQMQLKEAKAGTGKAHQLAESNYHAEKARISALERQLQQYGISPSQVANGNTTSTMPVTAPISGTVGTIQIETGAYIQPGVSMMDIVDNSKIHADLVVYEKDLLKVKVGQKVSFQLTNQNNQQIEGEIYGINRSFADDRKGVIVHARINNPKETLIPGMYVTGLIAVGNELSVAIPKEGVVQSGGKSFIYVVDDHAEEHHEERSGEEEETIRFNKVEVTTGVSELGYTQINPLEPLSKDAQVVTKGAFYLQSKESGPSEHGH